METEPVETATDGLIYVLNDDGKSYAVAGIENATDKTDIVISSVYDELPVTSIGKWAFYNCTNLTSITIPDSVTSIGEYVFSNCSGLTRIDFTGTVENWEAIEKSTIANSSTGSYTVYCIDGKVNKNGTVTMY